MLRLARFTERSGLFMHAKGTLWEPLRSQKRLHRFHADFCIRINRKSYLSQIVTIDTKTLVVPENAAQYFHWRTSRQYITATSEYYRTRPIRAVDEAYSLVTLTVQ